MRKNSPYKKLFFPNSKPFLLVLLVFFLLLTATVSFRSNIRTAKADLVSVSTYGLPNYNVPEAPIGLNMSSTTIMKINVNATSSALTVNQITVGFDMTYASTTSDLFPLTTSMSSGVYLFDEQSQYFVSLGSLPAWSSTSSVTFQLLGSNIVAASTTRTYQVRLNLKSSCQHNNLIRASIPAGGVSTNSVSGPTASSPYYGLRIDRVGPSLLGAYFMSSSSIEVVFDDQLDYISATNPLHYTVNGMAVTNAQTNLYSNKVFLTLDQSNVVPGTTWVKASSTTFLDRAQNGTSTEAQKTVEFPKQIKISEIATALEGSETKEFIELYNAGSNPVDISNWLIQHNYSNFPDNWTSIVSIPASTIIQPFSYYLTGSMDFKNSANYLDSDTTYSTPSLTSTMDAVRIVNGSMLEIDRIGWGASSQTEGSPGPGLYANVSLERKAMSNSTAAMLAPSGIHASYGNTYDSGNNSFDFVLQATPTPQNLSSASESYNVQSQPMIEHTAISVAAATTSLDIVARMGDINTPISQVSAELYYYNGDNNPTNNTPSTYLKIVGTHQAQGYYKFSLPSSYTNDALSLSNGIYYFLKVVTPGGSAYLSASSTADTAKTETVIAQNPLHTDMNPSPGWANYITGNIINASGTPLSGAFVFLEGFGKSATTTDTGRFYMQPIRYNTYNLVIVKDGYYKRSIAMNMNTVGIYNIGSTTLISGENAGSGGDTQSPRINWSFPYDGASYVPPASSSLRFFISFSKEINADTFSYDNVKLVTQANPDNNLLTAGSCIYKPAAGTGIPNDTYLGMIQLSTSLPQGLATGTSYYLILTENVRDINGNSLAGNDQDGGQTIAFSTGSDYSGGTITNYGTGGSIPPYVIGTTPGEGALNVPKNSKLVISFSQPMDPASISTGGNIKLYSFTIVNNAEVKTNISFSAELDTSNKIAVITPVSNLTTGKYRIELTGALRSASGIWMGNPDNAQNLNTYNIYSSYFYTNDNLDYGKPLIAGVYPSPASTLSVNPGAFNIQFSESLNPATVNLNTVKLLLGISPVSGSINYDPMNKTVYFAPNSLLAVGSSYSLTASGGATSSSITDLAGNPLMTTHYSSYTTSQNADASAPGVLYSNADDYSLAVTFSEPMNSAKNTDPARWGGSVLNPESFFINSLTNATGSLNLIAPYADGGGNQLSDTSIFPNLDFSFDEISNTLYIKGFAFIQGAPSDPHTTDFRLWIDNTTDKASNTVANSGSRLVTGQNFSQGQVKNSSQTQGMLGPNTYGGGGMTDPSTNDMGMLKAGIFPMNSIASQLSTYSLSLPTTRQIAAGYKIMLTFPPGFDVSLAKKEAMSPANNDLNGYNSSVVSFGTGAETSGGAVNDGVTVSTSTRTVIITLGISGTPPQSDYLHIDLSGIRNTYIPRGYDTGGYSVDAKIMDSVSAVTESIRTMPFYIMPGGSAELVLSTGGVAGADVDGINDSFLVFLSSQYTGPLYAGISLDTNGIGTTSISGLPSGSYWISTEPMIRLDGSYYLGVANSEPISLASATTTNRTLALVKDQAGLGKATATIIIAGSLGTDDIDVFASGPSGYRIKTFVDAGSGTTTRFYLTDGLWMIGVEPARPKGIFAGSPPMPDWMPPAPVQINVSGNGTIVTESSGTANDGTISFTIGSASKQIIGYVKDASSTPLADAQVWAYQPGSTAGMGAYTKTDTAGMFVLKVSQTGDYSVGVMKQGLPNIPERTVTVRTDSDSGSTDSNSTADIYSENRRISTSSLLLLTLKRSDYTISGKVTDGINPVAYAPVWAYLANGASRAEATTDSTGNYILFVENGAWIVNAYIHGYGEAETQTVIVNSSNMSQNLSPSANTAFKTISGKVGIDTDGFATTTEVKLANMPIRAVEYSAEGLYQGKEFGSQTDPEGNYAITVPSGIYRVDIWTPDYGVLEINNQDQDNSLSEPTDDDDYPGYQANINAISDNIVNADIIIRQSSQKTITLYFRNATSTQSGFLNIDGVDFIGGNPKKNGFHKTLRVQNLTATTTLSLSNGDYFFFLSVPGIGEFIPDESSNPNGRDAIKQDIAVSGDRQVDFSLPSMSTTSAEIFMISGTVYSATATSGSELAGAWVWISDPAGQYKNGVQTNASGTYSFAVPAGTSYKMGAGKPGYSSPEPVALSATSDISGRNFILNTQTNRISGKIYFDANSNGSYDSSEEISRGFVRAETSDGTKRAHASTDGSGSFELGVVNGTWKLYGIGDGYGETLHSAEITISGSDATANIKLASNSNWTNRSKSKPITPSSGGTLDDTASDGTKVKLTIPPNALGTSNAINNISTSLTSAVTFTNSQVPLNMQGINITATDNSGQAVTNLNDYVDIEAVLYKADVASAIANSGLTYAKLKYTNLSYYDSAIGDWVALATVRKAYYKTSGGDTEWTLYADSTASDTFEAFIDTVAGGTSYYDYKLEYASKTNHFTVFAVVLPYIAYVPPAPSPSPSSPGGGSVNLSALSQSYCTKVEYSKWSLCKDNYQSRTVETSEPSNCKLSKEQENQKIKSCTIIGEIKETAESSVSSVLTTAQKALNALVKKFAILIEEAKDIAKANVTKILSNLGIKRSFSKEQKTQNTYIASLTKDMKKMSTSASAALLHFVTYGTPSTKKMGEGERTGVLNSYKKAFKKLPQSSQEWTDVIKIANGSWPGVQSIEMETQAQNSFKAVYKRTADMNNAYDRSAVKIMAYGLIPADRNIKSEASSMKTFRSVYKRNPKAAFDWNVIRAIAYSGAKR